MNKKSFSFIVFVAVVLSFLVSAFFGNWFVERLALLTLVKKYNLISPRTPLVINTREEVRISETQDLVAIANKTKDRVASLVFTGQGSERLVGGLVAVSSDGWYLGTKQVLTGLDASLLQVVVLGDKKPVEKIVPDTLTDIVFIKTSLTPRSIIPIALPSDMVAGGRLALVTVLENGNPYILDAVLATTEYLPYGTWSSELPGRTMLLQTTSGMIPGHAVVNNKADLVGLWSTDKLITASVVQEAISKFLSQQNLDRPYFGFQYKTSGATNTSLKGLEVISVETGSPAGKAGLQVGDIILNINTAKVSETSSPDSLLTSLTPAKIVDFMLSRQGREVQIKLEPSTYAPK